jgi:hypothetical protein
MFMATSAVGHFCPAGSSSATQNPCMPGQYCRVGSSIASDCSIGNFCPSPSLQNNCPVGYFCNSTRLTAVSAICPIAHMCPLNSVNPTICPAGYYGPLIGRGYCESTTPGNYSTGVGLTVETSLNCEARFYCPSASTSARSRVCPGGWYCPGGGFAYYYCRSGMYCNGAGAAGEYSPLGSGLCPRGNYCRSGWSITACSAGYYCPQQASINAVGGRYFISGTRG